MSIILSAARIPFQFPDALSEESYDADAFPYFPESSELSYDPDESGSESSFDPDEHVDPVLELCLLFEELSL
jgi:hypothetical protein